MNKRELRKLISQHDFSYNPQLFSETDAIVEVAIKAGETSAKVETIEEAHAETVEKVETLENRIQWRDEDVDRLQQRVWELEQKITEVKEDVIEEVEEVEEKEGDPTEIEKTEEIPPVEKSNGITTIIGTAIIGAIILAIVKMFEHKSGDND